EAAGMGSLQKLSVSTLRRYGTMLAMSTSDRYHHGDLRNALLTAAERMIDADVRRRFSLRELAREPGASHAAPYAHLPDRARLVAELAARWMTDFVDVQEAAMTGSGARADLLAVGSAYVDWAVEHPSRFTVIFDPALNQGPGEDALGAQAARHGALLSDLVRRARAEGVLDGAADVVAGRLWATVHGAAALVLLGHLSRDRVRPMLEDALG